MGTQIVYFIAVVLCFYLIRKVVRFILDLFRR